MHCPQLGSLTNLCIERLVILGMHISETLHPNVIVHVLSSFDIKYSQLQEAREVGAMERVER